MVYALSRGHEGHDIEKRDPQEQGYKIPNTPDPYQTRFGMTTGVRTHSSHTVSRPSYS